MLLAVPLCKDVEVDSVKWILYSSNGTCKCTSGRIYQLPWFCTGTAIMTTGVSYRGYVFLYLSGNNAVWATGDKFSRRRSGNKCDFVARPNEVGNAFDWNVFSNKALRSRPLLPQDGSTISHHKLVPESLHRILRSTISHV